MLRTEREEGGLALNFQMVHQNNSPANPIKSKNKRNIFDRLQEINLPNKTNTSKHLKGHLAPRVSKVTVLHQRVIPGSLSVT